MRNSGAWPEKDRAGSTPACIAARDFDTPSNMDAAELVLGNRNLVSSKDANKKENNCFLPPLNELHIGTVGVADLQVPSKAQQEYEDGSAAVRSRKMADAESHFAQGCEAM